MPTTHSLRDEELVLIAVNLLTVGLDVVGLIVGASAAEDVSPTGLGVGSADGLQYRI